MREDPFAELKQRQRQMWASFGPTALFTTPVAGHVVRFAAIVAGETVLDVGTGTGVLAITAARLGAKVCGLDLTAELIEQARENGSVARVPDIDWKQGDAEDLPYPDASFDLAFESKSVMFHTFPENPAITVSLRKNKLALKNIGVYTIIELDT